MSYLTRPSLESLDLLIASNTHPQINMDTQSIKLSSDHSQHQPIPPEEFANYQYIGAILPQFYENNYPSAFRLNPILVKKNTSPRDGGIIDCFIYESRDEHQLLFHPDQISLNPEIHPTKYNCYLGQGEYDIVDLFEQPFPVDPAKEFFYVRSPNNSTPFENIISTCEIEEKMSLGEWMIYHNDEQKVIINASKYYKDNETDEENEELTRRLLGEKFSYFLTIEDRIGVPHLSLHIGDETNPLADVTNYGDGQKGYSPHENTKHSTTKNYVLPYDALASFDINKIDFNNLPWEEISEHLWSLAPKKKTYSLLYTSLSDLLKNKRWAFNNVLQSTFIDEYYGFTPNLNQHLVK